MPARHWIHDDPVRDDSTQAELFARFNLTTQTHVTLSMQRLHHSGFVDLPADPRSDERIVGLRLRYGF
ncbi:MAG TPA: hypothetical protein VLD39_06200 [Gammaproteobacteria bacterium]|nr:hypothetical protein [Gammaproteobacteria bacterium]